MANFHPDVLRDRLCSSKDLPEEDLVALVRVLDSAVERYGNQPGFNVVIALVHYGQFLELVPSLSPPAGLTGRALGCHLADALRDRDQLFLFTDVALMGSIEPGNPDAVANRIRGQMNADTSSDSTFRKPAQYITGTDSGFAISLAIDDRFWTDEW